MIVCEVIGFNTDSHLDSKHQESRTPRLSPHPNFVHPSVYPMDLLSLRLAYFLHWSSLTPLAKDPSLTLVQLYVRDRRIQWIDLLIAWWVSVSGLWEVPYWGHCPSSWNCFICIKTFFFWSLQMHKEGWNSARLRLPSQPAIPGKEAGRWASPFPRAIRCGIRRADSHLFIRWLCALQGVEWHVHRSLKDRNLHAVHSSSSSCCQCYWTQMGSLNSKDSVS
jgi:hypothetical protein